MSTKRGLGQGAPSLAASNNRKMMPPRSGSQGHMMKKSKGK